ncbi:hypothetical protein ER308_09605 [Egibacter rhizosphaerae]|uniref:Leucine-binding protein domain-containing protein n=1 Tax=Egibacter rhizosphaerae TaxID=1670831 RepID=A0A411YEU7_9ACTN|nr:ABC transporter substrate-binding protein [Egibacter rhizosphaerae]QBI19783.1 hypothetical protein ER308_09605 [Egibacter rhizosphaerae]
MSIAHRSALLALLLSSLLLALAACEAEEAADDPDDETDEEAPDEEADEAEAEEAPDEEADVRLGAMFPQSGDLAFEATEALQGVEVAVELFNEDGGLDGTPVELVDADAPDPEAGTSAVRQLVEEDDVDVIVGTYSSAIASAAVPAAQRLDTPYLETTAFAASLTEGPENILRTTISSRDLGGYAAEFIGSGLADELGVSPDDMNVAMVYTDDEFGTSIADAALDVLEGEAPEVVVEESYDAGTISDFSSTLLQIDENDVDAVVHVSQISDGILFWRQAQELDVEIPAAIGAGGGYGQTDFAEPLGEASDGIFNIVPPTSGSIDTEALNDETVELLERMQEKLEEEGYDQGVYTDWGFMGTWVFLNEILPNAASTSSEDLREAAEQVDVAPEDSITGFGFEFAGDDHETPGQNLRAEPVVQQWQDQELAVVFPEEFAVADFINVPLPPPAERDEIEEPEDEE